MQTRAEETWQTYLQRAVRSTGAHRKSEGLPILTYIIAEKMWKAATWAYQKRTIGSPRSIEDSTEMKEYCVVENRFALREWWKRIRMEASFCDHVRGEVLGHCVMELGT